MDVRVHRDQVGDALHTGEQRRIGGLEGVDDADRAVGQLKQPVVGDDDQGVDLLAQVLDAQIGGGGTLRSLERERPGDHGDGQRPLLMRRAGDDGARAGAGAAALATGHEDHVGALERLLDVGLVILRGLAAPLGIGTGTQSTA